MFSPAHTSTLSHNNTIMLAFSKMLSPCSKIGVGYGTTFDNTIIYKSAGQHW